MVTLASSAATTPGRLLDPMYDVLADGSLFSWIVRIIVLLWGVAWLVLPFFVISCYVQLVKLNRQAKRARLAMNRG